MKTIESLEQEILQLQQTVSALMKEKNAKELLDFPWVGNLGNWTWHVKSNKVYFNDGKILALGYKREDVSKEINYQFFTDKLHKDDYERVMQNMVDHLEGRTDAYEVEYRIQAKDGSYRWFYDRGKISLRDEDASPLMLAGIVFDITQKKELEEALRNANKKLAELAVYDSLTNLLNRRMIYQRISHEFNRSSRYGDSFCLIMFDLDHFKNINDTYGHDIGDEVLIEVSRTISKGLRTTDALGRWGGEEFMICLPKTALSDALKLGERLRLSVEEINADHLPSITASFGIIEFNKDKDISLEDFIKEVDHFMYMAKMNGRNQVYYGDK